MTISYTCGFCSKHGTKEKKKGDTPNYCNASCRSKNTMLMQHVEFLSKPKGSVSRVRIATTARARYDRPMACVICGYNKAVDVCHIKDIKDFPNYATVLEINSQSNLIALCKNHHWELDHDML